MKSQLQPLGKELENSLAFCFEKVSGSAVLAEPKPTPVQRSTFVATKAWNCRRRGFTLLELAIVMLVIGILAAVAVPKFADTLHSARVNSAADRIVADLTRAQSAAYGSSSSKTVTFSVASNQYTVSGVAPLDRPSGTYVVALSDDPYKSELVSVWGQGGTQTITFSGYGLPDKGGDIVVAAGGFQKTIVVAATSGAAVVQ